MTIVERNPVRDLVAQIRSDEFQQQVRMVLPPDVTSARFARATVTALLQNPDIAKADPDSIFQSLLRCAQDGLLPDGREAALVMFGSRASYIPMISGFRKIAAEFGWSIRTNVVYENDEFQVELGNEPRIIHHPVRPGAERGPLVAAYAVGSHGDGRREVEVMTAADVEKVRWVSRAKDRGPWKDWTERMWEKTAGRRLFAKLPLGDLERVRRVVDASDVAPAEAQALLYGGTVDRATGEITDGSGGAAVVGSASDGQDGLPPESQQAGEVETASSSSVASPAPGLVSDDTLTNDSSDSVVSEAPVAAGADSAKHPPAATGDDLPPEPVAADMLASALQVVVPRRAKNGREDLRYAGQKLGDVDDDDWLDWCLVKVPAERWDPVFRKAVEIVVAARVQS